jgi:soluble lytic murein transglycosylase-like protein
MRPTLITATILGLVAGGQAGLSGRLGGRVPNDVPSYTLQSGDTLTAVAAKFNVTIKDLASANGITNPDYVLIGDTLTIPGRAAVAKATAQAAAPATPAAASKLPAALTARPERLALMPRFDTWASTYGVSADLLKALGWMESGWQNDVVSRVAARGIGQLTPDTVNFVNDRLLKSHLDPTVADDNIRMSARFLSYLLDQVGGDERLALAAYYQGLGSLRKYGPLPVSRLYVANIVALRALFA